MKIRIKPGAVPENISEHLHGNAADSRAKPLDQQLEIELGTAFPNVSLVDADLVDEFAENVRVKIDNKVAKKAFLISLRQDFGHGSSTVDWADRMQAEINKQGNLRANFADRRHLAENDRRRQEDED